MIVCPLCANPVLRLRGRWDSGTCGCRYGVQIWDAQKTYGRVAVVFDGGRVGLVVQERDGAAEACQVLKPDFWTTDSAKVVKVPGYVPEDEMWEYVREAAARKVLSS